MTWRVRNGKYGNRKSVSAAGETFDSAGELKRWNELLLMQNAGLIRNLRRQVPYELFGLGGMKICVYKTDFDYFEGQCHISEDFKGVRTAEFILKEKLFKDNYPGNSLRLTGPWRKIEETRNAKARAKYAQKKLTRQSSLQADS